MTDGERAGGRSAGSGKERAGASGPGLRPIDAKRSKNTAFRRFARSAPPGIPARPRTVWLPLRGSARRGARAFPPTAQIPPMSAIDWSSWRPHLLAIAAFLVVSAAYFAPALGGKTLVQGDIINYKAMSAEVQAHREAYGEEPLWTNSMFGGMPAYQISMRNPGNWFTGLRRLVPRPISFVFVAMLGAYLMGLSFGMRWEVALTGALAYGLGTYLITFIEAGHNSKSDAVAWMPFVVAGLNHLFRGRWAPGLLLAGLGMVMEVTVNHLQITYYLFLAIGIWGLFEAVRAAREGALAGFAKAVGAFAVITALAVGANATRILTTLEYADWTIRGPSELSAAPGGGETGETGGSGLDRDYAFAWSYGIGETMTLLFPQFAGGGTAQNFVNEEGSETLATLQRMASGGNQQQVQQLAQLASKYWGPLGFTSGPIYLGAVVFFLFLVGCVLAPPRHRGWLIAATLLSFVLGWGRHFPAVNYFLFEHFPMYNKFRTVMMAFVIADLTMVALAMWGLQKLLFSEASTAERVRALYVAAGVVGVLALVALGAGALYEPLSPQDRQILADNPSLRNLFDALAADRAAMIRTDALRSLAFCGVAFGLLWMGVQRRFPASAMALAVGALATVDLVSVDLRYLNAESFAEGDIYERRVRQQLPVIQDPDPHFRVLDATKRMDQDGVTPFSYHAVGGYHGAKSRRYQDLISAYNFQFPRSVLNMLNTRYVIGPQGQVQRNAGALGNAWTVDTLVTATDADGELAALKAIDPARAAVIRAEDRAAVGAFGPAPGRVALTDYKANALTYAVDNPNPVFAVFSEVWYRGNEDWQAYLDGDSVDHYRVNYILRGMPLPAGRHELVFRFDPPTFRKGVTLSAASSGLLWLLIAGSLGLMLRGALRPSAEGQDPPAA